MNIGDVSGCLEIIGDYDDANQDLKDIIRAWAEEEWNRFPDWYKLFYDGDFKTYYKLSKKESDLYDAEGKMPESFVSKYRKKVEGDLSINNHFLYHKRNPNTLENLRNKYKKGMLYKVKCKICNRIFFMDSKSFNCVKWRSCVGAECLENTVNEADVDYSTSMYNYEQTNKLQVLDYQLKKVEKLGNPLTYYSLNNSLRIAYISDIHLLHHLKYYDDNMKKMIRNVVTKLYSSKNPSDIIIFGGDISSNTNVTIAFYKHFMRRYDFLFFQEFKNKLLYLRKQKKSLAHGSRYVEYRDKINKSIKKRKEALADSFEFSAFENYRNIHRSCETYEDAFKYFKQVKTFKKFNVSESVEDQILQIAKLLDIRKEYDSYIEKYDLDRNYIQNKIDDFEQEYAKPIEDICLSDYRHVYLDGVYAVLGNHEYIDFSNIETCVLFYRTELSRIGIKLLHNDFYFNDKFLIFGGTGFAKYDNKWNADTVVCCPNFTRDDEINETTIFEQEYKNALAYAKENRLCFLCVTHYPISSCLNNNFDREAIYFAGHNHQNKYIKTIDRVLYADNQIGYKDNNIAFRIATTGFELNPYYDMCDGMYQTTIKDYLQFYRYIGEDVGKGNVLYQRLQNCKANLYVVKRKGYYGFFIVTTKGSSQGISIVNGGVTKKLTNSTDMGWICENFDVVLSKYLQMLMPLRNAQEQLSKELKELGLDGTIHGCIVDIDFYHHIMLNPIDGSMEFYFSSMFGMKLNLDSFEEVIKSLEINNSSIFPIDCKKIRAKFNEKLKNNRYLLSMASNNYLIETDNTNIINASKKEELIVSRKDGIYEVSRKVNPLQRLFSGHVLRDFDLRLTETQQESYRKRLYTNRLFSYEGIVYKVVEDNGSEMIVAEEVEDGLDVKDNEPVLTGKTRRFALSALKSKISYKDAYDTYWITKK